MHLRVFMQKTHIKRVYLNLALSVNFAYSTLPSKVSQRFAL